MLSRDVRLGVKFGTILGPNVLLVTTKRKSLKRFREIGIKSEGVGKVQFYVVSPGRFFVTRSAKYQQV